MGARRDGTAAFPVRTYSVAGRQRSPVLEDEPPARRPVEAEDLAAWVITHRRSSGFSGFRARGTRPSEPPGRPRPGYLPVIPGLVLPKILDPDEEAGRFRYDETYRKRPTVGWRI
jgi:hypothetical protein